MPNYIVTAPTGQKFQVTAPDGATQDEILAYAHTQMGQGAAPAAPPAAPAQTPSFMDQAGRQLGLAGRAVIKGVAAVPTMAMDAGVATRNLVGNAVNSATGQPATPNYDMPSTMFNQALDQYLPHPQSTTEKVTGAIEEGLTGSKLPLPSGGSAEAPGAANAIGGRLTPAQLQAAYKGKSIGMKLTPGQETGSIPLQQAEAAMASRPLTSGPMTAIRDTNQKVLNGSWAKAIGESSAEAPDSTVMARANERLGEAFDNYRDPNRITYVDGEAVAKNIDKINEEFSGLLPNNGHLVDNPLVRQLVENASKEAFNGEELGTASSKLGKAAYKQMTGPAGDRDLGQALYKVKDYVDDLVAHGLTSSEQAEYAATRSQYRALMQLTSRTNNVNPNTGNVNGVSMANYLQKADRNGFMYGKNDTDAYNATRFAQAFKPVVGDSGTATRGFDLSDLANIKVSVLKAALARGYFSGAGAIAYLNNATPEKVRQLAKGLAVAKNPKFLAALSVATNDQSQDQ